MVIMRGGHQVLPSNPDGSFHYDNFTQVIDERLELFEAPYRLQLQGWAEGCDYDHEVIVGIGILPPEAFSEYQPEDTRLQKLLQFLGIK